MAHLFSRLFKKREMSNCNHPPSALHDFSQYDTEYITYCIEQEQKVSWLEAEFHTTDDPEEIAKLTLKAVCDFYGADWASIIEVRRSFVVNADIFTAEKCFTATAKSIERSCGIVTIGMMVTKNVHLPAFLNRILKNTIWKP